MANVNHKANPPGEIGIQLLYSGVESDACIDDVHLISHRQTRASRILTGKSPDDAIKLTGMLFSLCGTAQKCASVRAVEDALNLRPTARIEIIRDALVDLETLREHLLRIFLHWPEYTGLRREDDSGARVIQLRQRIESQISLAHVFTPGAQKAVTVDPVGIAHALDELKLLIESRVLGGPFSEWEQTRSAWERCNTDSAAPGSTVTSATALLMLINNRQWQYSFKGEKQSRLLPETLTPAELKRLMESWSFIATPTWHGTACENSRHTRPSALVHVKHNSTTGHHRFSLIGRVISQIDDVVHTYNRLEQALRSDAADTLLPTTQMTDSIQTEPMDHQQVSHQRALTGLGESHAARGRLFHSVHIKENCVTDYRILAPTEWNFHPQGVIVTSLMGLRGPLQDLRTQASILAELLDPCVGFSVRCTRAEKYA
jgi:Ni,Fe-hydrogenase I large subunit